MKSRVRSIILLTAIVFFVYLPAWNNQYVNWDDDVHFTENKYIRELQWGNVLTTIVNLTYIPLTSLSFAGEYAVFGLNPVISHGINVILHIFISISLYCLALQFGLSNQASLIAAIIFGIHPMHVESVAWATERKDGLYVFFYLISLLLYGRYVKLDATSRKRKALFIIIILTGLLSLLAKPMALSFPLILLLFDWYYRRKFSIKTILEKLNIAAIFAPIVWMTYIHHIRPAVDYTQSSLALWVWCAVFYLKKFFFPDYFTVFYRPPQPIELISPPYFLSLIALILLIISLIKFREKRLYVFSVLFYFFSTFFLFRFDIKADSNIVADRFMYLPSAGFCLFLGAGIHRLFNQCFVSKIKKYLVSALVFTLGGYLTFMTIKQIDIWQNSERLWTHQLAYEPYALASLVYVKLGDAHLDKDDFNLSDHSEVEKIMTFYKIALKINPKHASAYWRLGHLYFLIGQLEEAINCLKKAIDLDANHFEAYYELGVIYRKKGDNDLSREALNKALVTCPNGIILKGEIDRLLNGK